MTQTTMDSGKVIMSCNVASLSTSNDVCDSGNVNKDKNVESAANSNLGTPNDTSLTPAKDANLDNNNVGPVSFATILKGDTSQKSVFFTLVKFHDIPITVFMEDGLSVIATKLGKPLMLDSYTAAMCTNSWGRGSYARAIVELRADVELKDTIMYDWTPLRCSSCKVFGHVLDECPKKPVSDVLKNLKNPGQAVKGVQVGPKVGFKQAKQVYRLVSQKNCVSTRGKKKQAQASRQEVGNSNLFDVLISIENDDDVGTNKGNSKVAEKGVNSGVVSSAYGSSPVAYGSQNITPLAERISNLERKILDGKLMLVDDDGKPLNKVYYAPVNSDSNSGVEVAYDEMTQLWLVEVQMMQAYMRTKIMTSMILIILKV
ncbi:alpha/beta hydrolases superfamily protein [Tanacetum coccineum]